MRLNILLYLGWSTPQHSTTPALHTHTDIPLLFLTHTKSQGAPSEFFQSKPHAPKATPSSMLRARLRRRERRPQLAKTKIRQPGLALGVSMLLLLVTLLLCSFTGAAAEEESVASSSSSSVGIDGHYENQTLTRLAFGSCNKQVGEPTVYMSLACACVCRSSCCSSSGAALLPSKGLLLRVPSSRSPLFLLRGLTPPHPPSNQSQCMHLCPCVRDACRTLPFHLLSPFLLPPATSGSLFLSIMHHHMS